MIEANLDDEQLGGLIRDFGRALTSPALVLWVKGDWGEASHTLGLPSVSSKFGSCPMCSLGSDDFHTLYRSLEFPAPEGSYEDWCIAREKKVLLQTEAFEPNFLHARFKLVRFPSVCILHILVLIVAFTFHSYVFVALLLCVSTFRGAMSSCSRASPWDLRCVCFVVFIVRTWDLCKHVGFPTCVAYVSPFRLLVFHVCKFPLYSV